MTAATALGLGKGIGLIIVWIDEALRRHYNPVSKEQDYASVLDFPVVFFDKDFIRNLASNDRP